MEQPSTGKQIEVEVEGYDAPFCFCVSQSDYAQLRREERKHEGMGAHNLLVRTCTSHPNRGLEAVMEEDWTLSDLLIGQVAETLGLLRAARVKKSSASARHTNETTRPT